MVVSVMSIVIYVLIHEYILTSHTANYTETNEKMISRELSKIRNF